MMLGLRSPGESRKAGVIPRVASSSSFVTPAEAKRYNALLNQQRDIAYVTISRDHFPQEITVSDEEVQAYYDSHADEFIRPEQVKIEYVQVNAEQLAAKSNSLAAGNRVQQSRNWRLIARARQALGDAAGSGAAERRARELEGR